MNIKKINNFIVENIIILKLITYILLYIPLVLIAYNIYIENLGANPIEKITHDTGTYGINILMITLAITPLVKIFKLHSLSRFRRIVGLSSFVYIILHFFTWFGLDHWFNYEELYVDFIKKPYIAFGFVGLLILFILAITSFNKAIKLIGGELWKKIHKFIYLASILGVLHFYLSKSSKNNTAEPEMYIYILIILLGYRVFLYIKEKIKL